MTTLNEARELIQNRFVTIWGTTTKFTFDNEQDFEYEEVNSWIRLVVRHTVGGQHTLGAKGNRVYERFGLIFIQIFTLVGTGTKQLDTLSEQARNIYEGEKFGGVFVNDGNIRELNPEGKWAKSLVECDFSYNEIK